MTRAQPVTQHIRAALLDWRCLGVLAVWAFVVGMV
jgi:hypothetical protein